MELGNYLAYGISVASVALSFFTYFSFKRTKTMEKRIEYEYKARERIYGECYPRLFDFIRQCESWSFKFNDLLRHAKKGNIAERNKRFADVDTQNYFKVSAIYRFFAPIAAFKIFEETLTSADILIDKFLEIQYNLGKKLFYSISLDNAFGEMLYNDSRQLYSYKRSNGPSRQGLRGYEINKLVEFFIIRTNQKPRLMSFPEFVMEYVQVKHVLERYDYINGYKPTNSARSQIRNQMPNNSSYESVSGEKRITIDLLGNEFAQLNNIFHLFNPTDNRKPILLRIIMYNSVLCRAINIIENRRKGKRFEDWSEARELNVKQAMNEAVDEYFNKLKKDDIRLENTSKVSIVGPVFHDTIELVRHHIRMMIEEEISDSE